MNESTTKHEEWCSYQGPVGCECHPWGEGMRVIAMPDPSKPQWNPQPGDRVLIRNAGEYGWSRHLPAEAEYVGADRTGPRYGLARVYDHWINVVQGRVNRPCVTVLRSDLSPVEPREWPCNSLGSIHCYPTERTNAQVRGFLDRIEQAPVTILDPTFERHTGPETEETRRLTKEDYSDVEVTRKSVLFDEMVAELIETVSSKLAESYRARTRKEGK